MVLDIKMCRFDNVSWGFRLVGGSDFDVPLTVVKITEGSIAEEAGLRCGDVIVRINDIAASPLAHEEAHKIILGAGNVFYFGVQREEPVNPENPENGEIIERPATPIALVVEDDVGGGGGSPRKSVSPLPVNLNDLQTQDDFIAEAVAEAEAEAEAEVVAEENEERPESVLSEQSEIKLVEEEIAAVLSGESEVLQDHNVLGIFPKPGVCMSSDVLRTLNEDAIKTKAEKDKENKKWTTFLQKPNRPIPKSKQQIEAELHAANAYKVKIVKSAPKEKSPAVEEQPEPEPVKEPTPPTAAETAEVEDEEPPADTEVPNLEEAAAAASTAIDIADTATTTEVAVNEEEKTDKEKEATPEIKEEQQANENNAAETTAAAAEDTIEAPVEPPAKTEEELALERQLADVQKQLLALSSLPSTIQSTLDAVTKQLAELLPTFKLQQPAAVVVPKEEPREINLECIEENKNEEIQQNNDDVPVNDDVDNTKELQAAAEQDANADNEVESYDVAKRQEANENREETRQMEEEQNEKKQKRHDVIEELEEHLDRKNKTKKRSKRAFGPLTPSSERPLVLPGGRRWYRPKDAYNDEFIAETLSAQAELITGTTLGVNFMKYQKPERKIDLNRSEVYKIIHHLDRKPVRGIEVRAPVVAAEDDIRRAVQS